MFDFNFKFTLEELFGKKVDLLQEGAIDNPYVKASLEKDRVTVYAAWFEGVPLWYSESLWFDH